MKTLSFINLKGGCAKTTTAINVATVLTEVHGKRVLLIDNDKQGNASEFFGAKERTQECGTAKILKRQTPSVYNIGASRGGKIDLISANMSLEGAEWEIQKGTDNQADRMKAFLEKAADMYDYAIIDNPPSVSLCVVNALCASDEVIIPVTLDDWSLGGVEIISEQIRNLRKLNRNLQIAGVLITNFKKSFTTLAAEEWLRKNCRHHVFETHIRYSQKVIESTYAKKPLEDFSKMSAAGIDYRRFVKEYLDGGQKLREAAGSAAESAGKDAAQPLASYGA